MHDPYIVLRPGSQPSLFAEYERYRVFVVANGERHDYHPMIGALPYQDAYALACEATVEHELPIYKETRSGLVRILQNRGREEKERGFTASRVLPGD